MSGATPPGTGRSGAEHRSASDRFAPGTTGRFAPGSTGRFAPTPSGHLHLGNLRTAVLAWLFARSGGGRFVLRIDDLDPAARDPDMARAQLRDLAALGLDWDGPVPRQSERLDRYADAIERLVAAGRTYPCYCSRQEIRAAAVAPHAGSAENAYPGTCRDLDAAGRAARAAETGRPPALRLRADGARRSFVDLLAGPCAGVVDDIVLRRGDGTPAYNLAVVVDDAEDGVGQVVRGDDLLPTTPRQILTAELLGLPSPEYAHVPLAIGPDGERLAKRQGSTTVAELGRAGTTPVALLRRLAASLGQAVPTGASPAAVAAGLVGGFDPTLIPAEPWVVRP